MEGLQQEEDEDGDGHGDTGADNVSLAETDDNSTSSNDSGEVQRLWFDKVAPLLLVVLALHIK
eukprot:3522640-Ditylum_brightwellii.AAC.1